MKVKLSLLRLFFLLTIGIWSCGKYQRFNPKSEWEWSTLQEQTTNPKTINQIEELKKLLPIDDARFVILQLWNLKEPIDILKLSEVEKDQQLSGGGFYGYIPEYFQDKTNIPIPTNFDSLIECALYLAKIRNQILRIISYPNFKYQTKFLDKYIPHPAQIQPHPNISIVINTEAVEKVLKLYQREKVPKHFAQQTAEMPTFWEMLTNRKNLGTIPEPLPNQDDLTKFIYLAGKKEPVNQIWNWLNPWNYFGFAELSLKSDKYLEVVKKYKNNAQIFTDIISAKIGKFIPPNVNFEGQIHFGVNWGVRSWSTKNQIGVNIVQIKDDYTTFIKIATREIFRKIQYQIYLQSFGRNHQLDTLQIAEYFYQQFDNEADQQFYSILSEIFLEGSATYVAGKDQQWLVIDGIKEGRDLINGSYYAIYVKHNPNILSECSALGFGSYNSPYTAIGYHMTKVLVETYGNKILYNLLSNQYLNAYLKYMEVEEKASHLKFQIFTPQVKEKVEELNRKMNNPY
jgi:hypothetical protein